MALVCAWRIALGLLEACPGPFQGSLKLPRLAVNVPGLPWSFPGLPWNVPGAAPGPSRASFGRPMVPLQRVWEALDIGPPSWTLQDRPGSSRSHPGWSLWVSPKRSCPPPQGCAETPQGCPGTSIEALPPPGRPLAVARRKLPGEGSPDAKAWRLECSRAVLEHSRVSWGLQVPLSQVAFGVPGVAHRSSHG